MTHPRDVFDNPGAYWDFITAGSDDEFEGQYFERKEAGRIGVNNLVSPTERGRVKEQITECLSAFANANHEGGLLVLGVSSEGKVKGIKHLGEPQLNELTSFGHLLRNQAAIVRSYDCENDDGEPDKVLLIYVPHAEGGICETLGNSPKAWLRNGRQNIPVSDQLRESLKRDKRITDFERAYCCPFDLDDVDQGVLQEFRKSLDAQYDYNDEQLLYEIGAIRKERDQLLFTNAGFLFFARNPQRELGWAYIRLLRFEVNRDAENTRGLPSLPEKMFDGPIAHQIRKIRTFFRESGFFKTYQKRNPEGGFIDDPEFPPIAVDEAIVNAVAHRDYGIQLPIECIHYKDAFVVENPGRIQQRDRDVPEEFTLADTELNSMPRNSKLIEWLKIMRNEQGGAFVRALSEGTKRMRDEMLAAGLPSPHYKTSQTRTVVTLHNNVTVREALLRQAAQAQTVAEYTNLFPLSFTTEDNVPVSSSTLQNRRKDFLTFLQDALAAKGWFVDESGYGRIVAHRRGQQISLPQQVSEFVRFYPAYEFQLREYWGQFYLCVDYTLSVRNVLSVRNLLKWVEPRDLRDKRVVARIDKWQQGKIVQCNTERTRVYLYDSNREEWAASDKVIPDLPFSLLDKTFHKANIRFDLSTEVKRHSLALEPNSARTRADRTIAAVEGIAQSLFPLTVGELIAFLQTEPVMLHRFRQPNTLQVQTLPEPVVEFSRHEETANVRQGITVFGSYEDARKTVELVPVCTVPMRENMASLIERLKVGKFKYKGSERTFRTRFVYNSIVTIPTPEDILGECRRLLEEHPDWRGNTQLDRLFLVHTPEQGYASDDENAPYYRVKRLLLEQGIPCQMVDTPTLQNPDWKDLNLALNIVAKCGVTPWVLPDRIPDADFFIGLSYTQTHRHGRRRLVGYATVFNRFGRWEFFSGNTDAFTYEDRTKYFALLTKQTLERLELQDQPSIYFHYSARFSHEDRAAILEAARSIRPRGTYHFVSVNSHHNVRLYDARAETDGSLSRGSYVITRPNQILLSTTGYNPFRKALGTPKPLEVTIRTESPDALARPEPDLKSLAVQVLSLTKLNWASTDSICGEPITTKYAGNIAYLTDAFLRQTGTFRLHPVLESTPWFI